MSYHRYFKLVSNAHEINILLIEFAINNERIQLYLSVIVSNK